MSSSCKTTLKGAKSVTCATCWKPFTRYGTLGKGFVNSDVARSTCTADFPLLIEHKCLHRCESFYLDKWIVIHTEAVLQYRHARGFTTGR